MMLNMKIPDGKHIEMPPRKAKTQLAMYTRDRLFLSFGNSSKKAATVGSHIPTMEDMARRQSIKKKRKLKVGG